MGALDVIFDFNGGGDRIVENTKSPPVTFPVATISAVGPIWGGVH
jgi:hypothetical protein